MKLPIAITLLISLSIFSCNKKEANEEQEKTETVEVSSEEPKDQFGVEVNATEAISLEELESKFSETEKVENLTVKGEVVEVCQKKGCWMTLKTAEGNMRVTFKDYALFMPKDISGKEVIIHGFGEVKETPVATLKHFAEDAGKSEEEIAKITEPERKLTFEADGVKIL